MESEHLSPILKYSSADVAAIRRAVGLDERALRETARSVLEWYGMQGHMLKITLDPDFLERVIVVLGRGSLQQTKVTLDAIATVKTAMPEFYAHRDVDKEEFARLSKFVTCVPLPVLNTDLTRIIFIRVGARNMDEEIFNPMIFYNILLLINENRMYVDYSAGDTYVIDMKHFKMSDFSVFGIGLLKKVQIITSAYKVRIKGIHFINAPSYMDKVVFLLKQGLKDKLVSRVQVHASLAQFMNSFPRECLPRDYGGELKSFDELNDDLMNYLRSEISKKNSEDAMQFRTDESKRIGGRVDEEMLGIPGSFRTIDVD